ncbi:CTP synthase [Candidatus Uhrbacteria bacterium]|nr:CTP synthase [Candidatus Uhrbacteria bacterium]
MQKPKGEIRNKRRTYIFVVGGVMSGVGKGIATASIGALLKSRGLKVTAVKIDPYLNVDSGTLNPIEHGEVFVTKDGLETDQDLGNYERFLDEDLTRSNYMTTGAVYSSVINRERTLGYGGKTVEAVPHIPLEVISRIEKAAELTDADLTLVEIGGTVGEYQNVLYLEACRMMRLKNPKDVLVVLVSYLPVPGSLGEMKSKPTQYAVRTLNGTGLQPDLLICRATHPIDQIRKEKLSINCNVQPEDVIAAPDVPTIYEVPVRFRNEKVSQRIIEKLGLKVHPSDVTKWKKLSEQVQKQEKPVRIGIVGKYFSTGDFTLSDAYLSVIEALKHAAWHIKRKPELVWLNSEDIERNPATLKTITKDLDGILIPGGFGTRGIEGKLMAIKYVREQKIPYFGICYGMQLAMVETARNLIGWKDANTTEIDAKTTHPVIHLMNEQEEKMKDKSYGGSMRLGEFPCVLTKGSQAQKLYRVKQILERHRHRYEANPQYKVEFEKSGMYVSGTSPDGHLAEIIERPDHPFFVACQFHPEFLSRPFRPHPLFLGFLQAAAKHR